METHENRKMEPRIPRNPTQLTEGRRIEILGKIYKVLRVKPERKRLVLKGPFEDGTVGTSVTNNKKERSSK